MAGFQVSINGRFWVSTEAQDAARLATVMTITFALGYWVSATTDPCGRTPWALS
jgi:hypothetical protein